MKKNSKKPNVLLIMTDQQRADSLGCYGNTSISTPFIDHLSTQGVRYANAFSSCPSCIAARRSYLSGLKPSSHGMVGYRSCVEWDPDTTLPSELSRAGYQTQLVGKLHMWPERKRYGFDHMIWADGPSDNSEVATSSGSRQSRMHVQNDYVRFLKENGYNGVEEYTRDGIGNSWVARPSQLPEKYHHTNWCIDNAIHFLKNRDPACPFFLNIGFFAPHQPCNPPEIYFNRYNSMDLPSPVCGNWCPETGAPQIGTDPIATIGRIPEQDMKRFKAAYYGVINQIDDQLGRLFTWMGSLGLLEDTIIIFTSDHGELLGDHHTYRKASPFKGSVHIPLIITFPESWEIEGGTVITGPVTLTDLMPTVLDACALPTPDHLDGESLISSAGDITASTHDYVHVEHSGAVSSYHGFHMLTDGRMKYIWFAETGREMLFDIEHDPDEIQDLAGQHGETLLRWRNLLIEELASRPEGFVQNGQLVCVGREAYTPVINRTLCSH